MHFSLKAIFLVTTWCIWFVAAIVVEHRILPISFILGQFILLAANIAVALYSPVKERFAATCFVCGFLTYWVLLAVEAYFGNPAGFRHSLFGQQFEEISIWFVDLVRFGNARDKLYHYQQVNAVLRVTLAVICGVLTYVVAASWLALRKSTSDENLSERS